MQKSVPDVAATTGLERPSDADFSRVDSIRSQEQRAEVGSNLFPAISSAEMPKSSDVSESEFRLSLYMAMQELGHRPEHIADMQFDDIMRELQTKRARQMAQTGQISIPGFNRNKPLVGEEWWNENITNYQPSYQPGSTPIGLFQGLAR